MTTCLGYVRVSSHKPVDEGSSLAGQSATLRAECDRRGWTLELLVEAGKSGASMKKRPILTAALDRLDDGGADALMSIRLDRLSGSVSDFAGVRDRASTHQWNVVLLDPALDLATPSGEFVANVFASAAQFERRLISARTSEGMAQRAAEGVLFGRPRDTDEIRDRIVSGKLGGSSWTQIADEFNDEALPTVRGGARWFPSTVRSIAMAPVTYTMPADGPSTRHVIEAAEPWAWTPPVPHQGRQPVTAPPWLRAGAPLPAGVVMMTIHALGVPAVTAAILEVEPYAATGWRCEMAQRPQRPAA